MRGGRALRAAGALAAAALLIGAEGRDPVLDLAAPRHFPIEGDVPLPPPPPALPLPPVPPVSSPSALPAAPSPSPAQAETGAAPGSFTVQVGAFRSLEPARALAQRLADRGYDAFVVTVDLTASGGRGVWHRVRVGHFAERPPAVEVAGRLAGEERVPAQVLRESPVPR